MARIRTIKPEFWTNEALSALPPETHLLAAALLNYCDDDGFFNANPRLVVASCKPLREDSVSVHQSLSELSGIGYIRLGMAADGKRYGQVVKFTEHQRINRPTASKVKEIAIEWDRPEPTHAQVTEDSLPERKGKEQGKEQGKEESAPGGATPTLPDCPHQAIIDLYHESLPMLRRVSEWTPERQKLLRSRWREKSERQSLDWWRMYFERVATSAFLTGRTEENFTADLEWLVRPKNMPKVLEGKYDQEWKHGNGSRYSGYVDNSGAAEEAKRRNRERLHGSD